ncbi:hypothetical protein GN244_ATG07074 [Phytophthora infestans]|uniref:Uncharacterized protein n=1 Tax=Phytophthora infestans TaxID=4787 RepID=A0A833SWX4_PHYIN|nr:hypothetical protein GN244_ATG07074 [Phytophthora infestans]KAF4149302.1 hypothetical protein GN958_ATG01613 [Phytophthora infestans]
MEDSHELQQRLTEIQDRHNQLVQDHQQTQQQRDVALQRLAQVEFSTVPVEKSDDEGFDPHSGEIDDGGDVSDASHSNTNNGSAVIGSKASRWQEIGGLAAMRTRTIKTRRARPPPVSRPMSSATARCGCSVARVGDGDDASPDNLEDARVAYEGVGEDTQRALAQSRSASRPLRPSSSFRGIGGQ